jgi:hypothetical protein
MHSIPSVPCRRTYRQNKKNLEMCSATFGLFISFLQDRKFMLLLSLANQYCNIRGVSQCPLAACDAMRAGCLMPVTGPAFCVQSSPGSRRRKKRH